MFSLQASVSIYGFAWFLCVHPQQQQRLALQVAAWGVHCRHFKEHWVTGKHDYIIKSAESSGLINIISNALAADAQLSSVEGHVWHTQQQTELLESNHDMM